MPGVNKTDRGLSPPAPLEERILRGETGHKTRGKEGGKSLSTKGQRVSGSKLEMEKSAELPGRPRKVNQGGACRGGALQAAVEVAKVSPEEAREDGLERPTLGSTSEGIDVSSSLTRMQYLLAPEVGAGNPSRGLGGCPAGGAGELGPWPRGGFRRGRGRDEGARPRRGTLGVSTLGVERLWRSEVTLAEECSPFSRPLPIRSAAPGALVCLSQGVLGDPRRHLPRCLLRGHSGVNAFVSTAAGGPLRVCVGGSGGAGGVGGGA